MTIFNMVCIGKCKIGQGKNSFLPPPKLVFWIRPWFSIRGPRSVLPTVWAGPLEYLQFFTVTILARLRHSRRVGYHASLVTNSTVLSAMQAQLLKLWFLRCWAWFKTQFFTTKVAKTQINSLKNEEKCQSTNISCIDVGKCLLPIKNC